MDAFAGASFHIYTRENVSYEDLIMQSGREKVRERVQDDGFFSSIGHENEDYDEDALSEFQNSLNGETSQYVNLYEGSL